MRPEARILAGLALVSIGAAGLMAMNLWTVPMIVQGRPLPKPDVPVVTTEQPRASAQPPSASTLLGGTTPIPVASVLVDGGMVEAAEAGAPLPVLSGATSKATDGTTFDAIVFEPQSKALSKELINRLEPVAAYMRNNYGMMVTLTGHGDPGMDALEYVRMGRFRAGAVLRTLVDYGVSGSRIGIATPKVEGDQVVTGGVAPGTVEVLVEPRFLQPKKGENDVP